MIKDVGNITDIEPGTFDDCTFRNVLSLHLIGTGLSFIRQGALAGLSNLKTLALYENYELKGVDENALEGLVQLEEFILQDQKQFKNLSNVTEKMQWKYLRTLTLTKNSLGSVIKRPTFKGCARVEKLNLSSSEITAIGLDSFEPMRKTLLTLDLSNNRLKTLPSGLLANLFGSNFKIYLSKNLWACDCSALELREYEISNLITDSPLACDSPDEEKGNCVGDFSVTNCYSSTTFPTVPYETTNSWDYDESEENLDHLMCLDDIDSYCYISLATEYQYFTIRQESDNSVVIQINNPDSSLALVYTNDRDYKANCKYNLLRRMEFRSLNQDAGYIFCLIKKSSHATSPRNCLPFHFTAADYSWTRDRIVLILVCTFALLVVIGLVLGGTLFWRYRKAVRINALVRKRSGDSRTKKSSDDFNSTYQRKKMFLDLNSSNLR